MRARIALVITALPLLAGAAPPPTPAIPHVYRGGYPVYLCPDGSAAIVIGTDTGPAYQCPDGSTKALHGDSK